MLPLTSLAVHQLMNLDTPRGIRSLNLCRSLLRSSFSLQAAEESALNRSRRRGRRNRSIFRTNSHPASNEAPKADLEGFRTEIGPILAGTCVECHGPDKQKAKFRVDTLDPDLVGKEGCGLVARGDGCPDQRRNASRRRGRDGRRRSQQGHRVALPLKIQIASQVRRAEQGHSSFRRMTRYEYNYALQDLLGLPFDFAKDLPPTPCRKTASETAPKCCRCQPSSTLTTSRSIAMH